MKNIIKTVYFFYQISMQYYVYHKIISFIRKKKVFEGAYWKTFSFSNEVS